MNSTHEHQNTRLVDNVLVNTFKQQNTKVLPMITNLPFYFGWEQAEQASKLYMDIQYDSLILVPVIWHKMSSTLRDRPLEAAFPWTDKIVKYIQKHNYGFLGDGVY